MNAKPNPKLKASPDKAAADKVAGLAKGADVIAAKLAAFTANLRHEEVPAKVRTRALHHMLDAAGIAVASTRYEFAHRVLSATRALGPNGDVPVLGTPALLTPRDAAMVNGYLCHGLDYDDTHVPGVIHPTTSVLPAVISAGHMAGCTGEEMVTAFVIGVEAAARIATAAKSGFHQVGFHPTGMVGVFACALAAGRLLGLNEKGLRMAQGIAVSMASGSLEFVEDGAWNKRLHPGWAAQAGITAAVLAREGFVGATRPYEGRFGLYNAYMGKERDRADLALATAGLGETWELLQVAIKPYPACHLTHACIDAAVILKKKGVEPGQIKSVVAKVPKDTFKVICEPEANKLKPANSYDAQFSVQYLTAAALVRGSFGLADLDTDALANEEVMALTQKVRFADYPESPFPKAYSGGLIITLNDGREVSHMEPINRGAADRPLSNEEIVAKYRDNAGMVFNRARVAAIEEALLALDATTWGASAFEPFSTAGR